MRPHYTTVIEKLNLDAQLSNYQPTVIGTPPLCIDIESSDIDIACTAQKLTDFVAAATRSYSHHTAFIADDFYVREVRSVRCLFELEGWEVELFCQQVLIAEQWGVRHFNIEKVLLELDERLRTPVIELKRAGLNTEAAFASVLDLAGDPFESLLELESWDIDRLNVLVLESLSGLASV